MPSLRRPHPLALVAVLGALTVSGCGGDDPAPSRTPSTGEQQSGGSGLEHIHGLGVRDGTLYIATHSGLFIAPRGDTKARAFGNSRQDVMGFSIVAPDRFIGSGHPAPGQSAPPNLGLIESTDAGRSWRTLSLSGEADFHLLESAGARVYGFDATGGRLMASADGGRSWKQRTPPAAIFGLAIDPTSPSRIVASTEGGVFASPNGGEGWRPLRDDLAGLLAWPARDRLFMVDGQGAVQLSSDGGSRWRQVGSIGGQPAAFLSDGPDLYAALGDGTVKRSSNGGVSWTLRASP